MPEETPSQEILDEESKLDAELFRLQFAWTFNFCVALWSESIGRDARFNHIGEPPLKLPEG